MSSSKAASLILVLCAPLALAGGGCGDDGGQATADASLPVDAPLPVDAAPNCPLLEGFYPDLGSVSGTAIVRPTDDLDPTGPQYLTLEIPLNEDTNPDVLFIEVWGDAAPHDMGYLTGTFALVQDNADLFECGNCVYIAADRQVGQPLNFHMASSGTITIDTIDDTPGTGSFSGSLSNVVMREVTVTSNGQVVVEGGCRTRLEAVAFSAGVQAPASM